MKQLITLLLTLCICTFTNAQPFRFIVAADGSGTHTTLQSAIDACPDNERSIIFVKNGTYYGQTYLGTKTVASTKLISLIGESHNQVILTYDKSLPMVTKFEEATTFQLYAKDFYAENITFANTAGVSAGQALALYTAGDRATFKNCYIKGFQDTYRSKKGTRAYLKDCKIEGTVDFIYAGGTVFFDDCELHCLQGGGYIVAPEDAYQTIPKTATVCDKFLRLGFIFRNCDITAQTGVADNSYYLGRPWNTTAGAFYLNCKLGKHINPKGWKEWNGNEISASFAEYNSMNADGTLADVSGRVSWSFQLPQADVDNLMTTAGIYGRISTEIYEPVSLCVVPTAPVSVSVNGNLISWSAVDGVTAYIILKDGKYLSSGTETTFTDDSGVSGIYSVRSVGTLGQLSTAISAATALNEFKEVPRASIFDDLIYLYKPATIKLFSLNGDKVGEAANCQIFSIKNLTKGVYLVHIKDLNGGFSVQKFIKN